MFPGRLIGHMDGSDRSFPSNFARSPSNLEKPTRRPVTSRAPSCSPVGGCRSARRPSPFTSLLELRPAARSFGWPRRPDASTARHPVLRRLTQLRAGSLYSSSARCAPARRGPRERRDGLRCQFQGRTGEATSDGGDRCGHARARRPSTSISKQTSGRVRRQLRGRADEATRDDGARYRHEQATRSSTSTSKQTGAALRTHPIPRFS